MTRARASCLIAMAWLAMSCTAAERPVTLTPVNGAVLLAPAYFGIHVHNNGSVRRWPDIPVGSIRLWDARVTWANLEPRKGSWDFARLDEYVSWATSRKIEILLPLGLTPKWASARPDEPGAYGPGLQAEPSDLADWRTYVKTVVQRYRGRIAAYEIWNEANTKPFFTGSPEALVQLTVAAADEIRRADPAAKVIAPSGVGLDARISWPSQILALGAGAVVDAASYHLYHGNQPPESMIEPALKLKSLNKAAGFDTMPMWNTEFGYLMPNDQASRNDYEKQNELSEQTAADYLPRDLLLAAALGYQRFFWYAWDNSKMGLLEPDNVTPRRIAKVYGQTIQLLSGMTLQSCIRDPKGLWTCALTGTRSTRLWALWVDPGANERVQPVPSALRGPRIRLDGNSNWSGIGSELPVTSVVMLVSEQR